jgi:hypothetical protein
VVAWSFADGKQEVLVPPPLQRTAGIGSTIYDRHENVLYYCLHNDPPSNRRRKTEVMSWPSGQPYPRVLYTVGADYKVHWILLTRDGKRLLLAPEPVARATGSLCDLIEIDIASGKSRLVARALLDPSIRPAWIADRSLLMMADSIGVLDLPAACFKPMRRPSYGFIIMEDGTGWVEWTRPDKAVKYSAPADKLVCEISLSSLPHRAGQLEWARGNYVILTREWDVMPSMSKYRYFLVDLRTGAYRRLEFDWASLTRGSMQYLEARPRWAPGKPAVEAGSALDKMDGSEGESQAKHCPVKDTIEAERAR